MKKRKLRTKNTAAESETAPIMLPKFGKRLAIAPCTAPDGSEWYRISPKPAQRMRHFLQALVSTLLLMIFMLAILYLPDVAFDYAHRGQDFMVFFAKFFVIAVAAVSIVAAFNTLLRDFILYVMPERGLIVSARSLNKRTMQTAISLKDCAVVPGVTGLMFRRTRLYAERDDASRVIAEASGSTEDITELNTWLDRITADTAARALDKKAENAE